jgi:hypothetical protein
MGIVLFFLKRKEIEEKKLREFFSFLNENGFGGSLQKQPIGKKREEKNKKKHVVVNFGKGLVPPCCDRRKFFQKRGSIIYFKLWGMRTAVWGVFALKGEK